MDKNLKKLEQGVIKLGKAVYLISRISISNVQLSKSFYTAKEILIEAEDIINNAFYQHIDNN